MSDRFLPRAERHCPLYERMESKMLRFQSMMLTVSAGIGTAFRAAAAGGLLLMSTPIASADDWTMGGQNLSNWRNQGDTPISSQNVAKLKTKWVFTTGGDVSATPAVANGIVYFPDFAGNFYAVNAKSGALMWKHQLADWTGVGGDYARNDPAIYGGMVILGNQAGNNAFWNGSTFLGGGGAKVVAVDANTGALKWMAEVETFPGAMVTSSP